MSARQLLDRVEETGLVDARTLSKLRREIENSAKEIKLPAVAKFLVEKGHMTKSQVDRMIRAIKLDDEEMTAADIAPPKRIHNTDTLTTFSTPGKKTDKPSAIDGLTEIVPVELIDDGTRIYGIDEVIEHDEAVEVEVEVERTRVLGALDNDPLFGGSVLATPGTDVAFGGSMEAGGPDRPSTTGFRGKVDTRNQWQTKWLFLGFGLLSITVILGAVLVLALSGESAENALKSAEDRFGQGAYLDAAKKYNEFYTKFTGHEDIGYAKVREVQSLMAAPYERKNFTEVFAIAQEHLPRIIDEPSMDVFRDDLGAMLPAVALYEADLALSKTTQDEMAAGLVRAMAAKALVDNPGYIPNAIQKKAAVKASLERLDESIKAIVDTIDKEKNYDASLSKIQELTTQGKTNDAFAAYYELTRTHGDMAARQPLRDAMKKVSAREIDLVESVVVNLSASTSDAATAIQRQILLSSQSGVAISALKDDIIPVLAEGAVYGVNAGDGSLVWRRHVGFETKIQPKWVDETEKKNLIVCDEHQHEIICLNGRTGALVWRTSIGEAFVPPTVSIDTIYVAATSGLVLRLDPFTGSVMASVRLPKQITTSLEKAEGIPYVYAVGRDSNLYLLSAEDLTCKEVFYVGHVPDSVMIGPSFWSGHLLIAINGSGYCDLHVLRFIEKGTQAERAQVIRIATGPVKSPPTRLGRWMLYLAETGDLKILELNTTEVESPIRKLAEDRFENRGGDRLYMAAEGSDLWIASKGINRYRVQRALGKFERQSIVSHGDFFLGPISKIDTYLFHLRRRDGSKQVSVAAVDSQTLAEVWRTDFGASSPAGPTASDAGMIVVSSQGDTFKIDQSAIESRAANSPVKASSIDQPLSFVDRVVIDANQHAYVGKFGTGDVLLVDNRAVTSKLSRMQSPADSPACAPIGIGSDLLVPTTKGQVVRVNPANGQIIGNPFQPSLRPGQETRWNRPVIFGEGVAVIGDMERTVYALNTLDRTGLREVSKLVTEGNIISDFATDGHSAFTIIDVSGVHRLVRLDMAGGQLAVAATIDLPGQVVDGPRVIGSTVFALLDNGKLHSFDLQCQAGWQLDVQNQRLAGILARAEAGWDVALVSGRILRINGQGTIDQTLEVGQPILQSPIKIGQDIFVSAADGTLLMLDPQKF